MNGKPALREVAEAITARRKRFGVAFEGPDCCIGAAAVSVDVLRHFGFDGRPLAVSALVEKGSSSLLIGFTGHNHGPETVDVHVVVMVEGSLLDVTIESAHEKQRELDIPPVFLEAHEIPDGFDRSQTVLSTVVNGNRLRYASFPANRGYLASSHWSDKALRRRLVSTIIEDVNQRGQIGPAS